MGGSLQQSEALDESVVDSVVLESSLPNISIYVWSRLIEDYDYWLLHLGPRLCLC